MDDWLQLLGMFIADGCCNSGAIYISALKSRKIAFNTSILTKLGLDYKYDNVQDKFIILKGKYPEIYEHLDNLSVGALNKYLPEIAFNLSERQSRILLESLLEGDGSSMEYKGETFNRYGTISLQLANDVSRLAVHCGYSGIIKISEEPTGIARVGKRNLGSRAGQVVEITQKHTYYKVSIITKQNQPWINKKQNESNVEKLIDYVDPNLGVYIAIDGPVCYAKIKQQRQRRFRSVHDKLLFDKIKSKYNVNETYYWNNSAISPGTKFMNKLHLKLTFKN
jgi:hypothetical protein